jgi:hypothetical protein
LGINVSFEYFRGEITRIQINEGTYMLYMMYESNPYVEEVNTELILYGYFTIQILG